MQHCLSLYCLFVDKCVFEQSCAHSAVKQISAGGSACGTKGWCISLLHGQGTTFTPTYLIDSTLFMVQAIYQAL